MDLEPVFPDHALARDQALARINDAIRQAAERLHKRGFQTYLMADDAGETKLLALNFLKDPRLLADRLVP